MGVATFEGQAVQFPSLERLETINSAYLHRDKTHIGYGLFVLNDRIVGLRGSRAYWLITFLHTPVIPLGSFLGILYPGFAGGYLPLLLVLLLVELSWIGLNSVLVIPAMDRVFRGRGFSTDELEDKKNDFEARRRDVWGIEVRQANGLSAGHVEFRLRSGGVLKVRMLWTRGRGRRFEEMFRLVGTFTGRQPIYNYKGWAIWRLN